MASSTTLRKYIALTKGFDGPWSTKVERRKSMIAAEMEFEWRSGLKF